MQKNPRSLAPRHADRRRLRSRAAFTLTEVMIAFTIMVAVLCGSLTAMQSGYKAIDTARCSTLAAQIMQSRIEQLRLKSWGEIEAEVKNHTYSKPDMLALKLAPTEAEDVIGRFALQEVIQPIAGRANIVNIALTVTWTGMGSDSHSRTYTTRYTKNGLYDYYF